MRLGGYFSAERADELAPLCDRIDEHGLSAIPAPGRLAEMAEEECVSFGDAAKELDLVIGEAGMWQNLLTLDPVAQRERIALARTLLRKAELMDCRCVVVLVGSKDPSDHPLAPHPAFFNGEGEREFREIVLRILDGLELERARFVIEPWYNAFCYQPEAIASFIESVGHPRLGVHLDLMNMVDRASYYDTTGLVRRAFDLLADRVGSVHLKDIRWDPNHLGMKWDEVLIGDGVVDYDAYLRAIATELPDDITCYCEHLTSEEEYADNFARLHDRAERAGVRFHRRHPVARGQAA